jgi:hypothetical protein
MTRKILAVAAASVIALLLIVPAAATAQEGATAVALDVVRQVAIDPTTYAPAVISFVATSQDWKTSQVLFSHGWVEANPRFTVSGLPNDVPVAYSEGKRMIRRDALTLLQYSMLNNVAAAVGSRLLMSRYPSHKKLVRVLSWVERIAFASLVTYRNSADHLRQAGTNRRLAREYGYSP